MTKINEASKIVLDKIWELAGQNGGHYKLDNNKTFMPLSIEKLGKKVITICHYGELNGDLMRDPEMLFWKDERGDYFPYYFRNDYVGAEEFVGVLVGGNLKITDEKQQKAQTEFADMWLNNIKEQQELV